MKVIEIKNVHKTYNETEVHVNAVNGVTLDFQEAEFAAIVGPSGSGKTTLLNLIGGLDVPTSGQITIDGTNLSKLKSSQLIDFRMRNIGFVFQAYNLIPVLTAKENVEFIMNLQKWSRKERDDRTFELLKAVGLSDRADSRPAKMSGGQQQRIAVARATLLEIMEKLNHEEKITFIFSTHDARVVKMAHRVITLEDGEVVSDDIRE
jgi:putative ABC transport system ATP-binding protein